MTADKQNRIIEDGFVCIDGGRITEVGEGSPSESGEAVISRPDCVVIPGLITAHTHLYGMLLRGASLNFTPPSDFAQVLQRVWWPVDTALTLDDAYASALAASCEMLRTGSTFFADTYSGPKSIENSLDAIRKATEQVGIRSMLAFEITERNSREEADRGLKENARLRKSKGTKVGLTSTMVSVHASFTVSDEIISESAKLATELGVPLTIHTSEGLVDLYHNLERYGERTVERLARLRALRPKTVLAHCVHVDETELDLIAKARASVAHNPMSNMLNAVGVAPVPQMLAKGINVGLGNDGWIYDPFENMRCAMTIHRLASGNPSAIGPSEVFKMATIEGARCYGLDNSIGSIEKGKLADLVLLDGSRIATPLDADSVIGHIVNSFTGHDVATVFVDGRVVVDSGRPTLVDEAEVSRISRQSARSLWKRLSS